MSDLRPRIGVVGATSMVGECLLPLLMEQQFEIVAFSRKLVESRDPLVEWARLDSFSSSDPCNSRGINFWVCVAPIWVLPDYFSLIEAFGAKRLVVVSSTSRFTKRDSNDLEEQDIAFRLADSEAHVQAWAKNHGVEWVILRPTLIYGFGRDKNIAEIARFIRRFRFFPVFGQAKGLRQPIHVADVAMACVGALKATGAANKSYNISGGEVLAYHEMVRRVFASLGYQPRLLTIPLWLFRLAVIVLRQIPGYGNWSTAMAERMNSDMAFDHSAATCDFDFEPRSFRLADSDLASRDEAGR